MMHCNTTSVPSSHCNTTCALVTPHLHHISIPSTLHLDQVNLLFKTWQLAPCSIFVTPHLYHMISWLPNQIISLILIFGFLRRSYISKSKWQRNRVQRCASIGLHWPGADQGPGMAWIAPKINILVCWVTVGRFHCLAFYLTAKLPLSMPYLPLLSRFLLLYSVIWHT